MQILQKKEAIKTGWELTKKHLGFSIIVFAVYMGITVGVSAIQTSAERLLGRGLLTFNIMLVEYLILILLGIAIIKIFLDLYDGKKPEAAAVLNSYEQFFDFVICYVLVTLIVIGGFILLIVPGIIWALKYQFALYLVVDRKMKPLAAIKLSGKMTHGHKVNLFLFWWVILGINILGLLCCCVGIIPSAIVTRFAFVHIYRTLLSDYEKGPAQNSAAPVTNLPPAESLPVSEVKQEQNTGNPISECTPAEDPQNTGENS